MAKRLFYRMLLQLYPPEMRAEFGAEMERAFASLCREQRGSLSGLARLVARESRDAVRAAMQPRRTVRARPTGTAGNGSDPMTGVFGGAEIRADATASGGGLRRGFAQVATDLRLAARSLRKDAAFSAVAIVTLALGIGVHASMFGLVDATLLRPIPAVADPEGLVVLYDYTRQRHGASSYPDVRDLRRVEAFSGVAGSVVQPVVLQRAEGAERLTGQIVSASFFDVLGVRPVLGRGFLPEEEDGFGAHPVTVLSHDFWERGFASDPRVVGREIRLNGRSYEVVGVAPPGFRGHALDTAPDLWVPTVMLGALTELPFGDEALDFRGLMMFSVVARLREGVSLEASQAAVDVAAVDIERDAPGMFDRPRDFLVVEATRGAFRPEARGEVSRYAGTLFVATGGLLLVACVNIAGLYSVRAAGRQREIAVRLALGAGRRRVVQQLMSEALLLSCVGGVGAIFVAIACLPLLERLHLPAGVDPSLHLDVRLLSFTLALAVATGVVFGVAPALGSSGRGAGAVLRQVRGGVRRWRGVDARSLLVVAQVAVTVVLLVGAGLLVRTVVNLWSVERGFDTDRVLVASFELQRAGYDEAEGRIFLRGVAARARGLTGVRSAAVSADVPLGGVAGSLPLYIEALSGIEPGVVRQSLVGAGYFATLGARLEAGRDFDDFDREGSEGVVIVNRALANLAWPDRDPLGKQVRSGVEGRASTVVGVVSDYRHADLRREPEPRLYWPIEQQYSFAKGSGTRRLMVRTEGEPLGMAPAVRAVVRAIDPELPVFDLVSMRQLVAGTIIRERQSAAILIAFSVIALALSAIGLFGVLAYAVAQRRSEIGIRCALGALESQVAASVVRGGVGLAAAGVVLGSAAAAASARVLSSWLYGIRPHDPVTYATIAVLVLLVAGLASFVPARRATRVDPAVALRGEG